MDDPSKTQLLCIDVDTLNGWDSHLDNLFDPTFYNFQGTTYTGSNVEGILARYLEFNDARFNQNASDSFVPVAMSISIAGAPPSPEELAAFTLFETIGSPIIQAAPNVNQGYFDWGSVYPDVINVGAWNQGSNGGLLLSSLETIPTLDILADGYVEKVGWGANFGTSFATPKVAASLANYVNDFIEDLNASGSSIADNNDNSNYDSSEYAELVDWIVETLSTNVSAQFENFSYDFPIPVLSDSLEENGYLPLTVSGLTGLSDYKVQTASLYEVGNTAPSGSASLSGIATQGETLTAITSSIADADGLGSFSYQWLRDGSTISGATSSTYALTYDDVGATVSVRVSYTDGQGTAESLTSLSISVDSVTSDDDQGNSSSETLGAISANNTGSGANVSLDFYVDPSLISEDVTSFDMVVSFDSDGAEYVSADLDDFLGFANVSGETITLSGISLAGVSTSDPLFTINFTDLDTAEDLVINITDVLVNNATLESSTLLIGGPEALDVSVSVASRSGAALPDVIASFNDGSDITTATSSSIGVSTVAVTSGSDVIVTAALDYDGSTKSITSQDALDALKLSVGFATSAGTKTAFDYIAADFNQDGRVTSQDALAILKNAVGLPTTEQAEWVFVDTNGDYSDVSRSSVSYESGLTISDLASATELSLTGILIGDVNDSYSGLIA